MIFSETFGPSPGSLYKLSNPAIGSITEKNIKTDDSCTFSEVVDKACDGLIEKQIKYSIRRIREMEEVLSVLEQELNEFLEQNTENCAR